MDVHSEKVIVDFLKAKLTAKDFEAFVYSSAELEAQLGADIYLELISINYNSKHCRKEVENLMHPLFKYGEMHTLEILTCIDALLLGEMKILEGIGKLYNWAWEGYTFLAASDIVANYGDQGKSIILMLDDTDDEQEIRRKAEKYQPDFWDFLRNTKVQLLDGRIILTGNKVQGEYQGVFEFLISS